MCADAEASYTIDAHGGDVALQVSGADLAELAAHAAAGLGAVITDPARMGSGECRVIALDAQSPEDMLVRLLNELVYLFDTQGFVCKRLTVRVATGRRLEAEAQGGHFDPVRHEVRGVVKAATYHDLAVTRAAGRLRARIVLDL
ncbi:MAG TPA: archease [Acidobacteriota bacterium]|nr:archease [Acidobacteriota bacterium]HQF87444.1 archease [Acidobacteriota bacterium]HQG92018.1 archease [Acidobacteriota bacterium]